VGRGGPNRNADGTKDDRLKGRCARCWVVAAHCVCHAVPRLSTAVEIVVVRHHAEALKSTNTARIAALALPALCIVDYGDQPAIADRMLGPLVAGPGTCLVYPAEPRAPWPAVPPRRLVFLDGSWAQTRRMARKLRCLAPLPRLWLPEGAEAPSLRLRRSTTPGGRSTLEAIAESLRMVGEPAAADVLEALAATHVERVLRARGHQVGAIEEPTP
jgi:DTW domain-containing protein YfiP